MLKAVLAQAAATMLAGQALLFTGCASLEPVRVSPAVVQPTVGDYQLGPSDKVRIIVFGEPNLTGEYSVSGVGTIAFPLIGDVHATGLTAPALQAALTARLEDGYIKTPTVAVELLSARPYYILGEVEKPGEYAYRSGLTVLNAVATAGGFTYRANQRRISLKHSADAREEKVQLVPELQVRPGDTIRIVERYF